MASLDVSLDDRIKASNKARGGQRRGSGGGARGGRGARGSQGSQNGAQRSQKGSQKKAQGQQGAQPRRNRPDRSRQNIRTPPKQELRPRLQGENKVLVEGLVNDLDNVDVQDIFAPLGAIKTVQINYDINGHSLGTAEVVFAHAEDAAKAVGDYDMAEVDGVPMRLRLATRVEIPKARPQVQRARQSGQGAGRGSQQNGRGGRARGSGGRGGKRQQGSNKGDNRAKQQGGNKRKQQKKASVPEKEEDLDKELEAYQKGRDGSANTFAGQPERPPPIKLNAEAKA